MPQASIRSSSRSSSRSISRRVRSLISPSSRSSMTAVRWAPMTPRWISSCSIALLAALRGLVGSSVARCCVRSRRPDSSRSNSGWCVGQRGRGALDLVEAGLVGGGARDGRLVAVGLDAVPARPSDDPRQREPLSDERDEDHGEGDEQDQVALREGRRAAPGPPPGTRRRAARPSPRRRSAAWRAGGRAAATRGAASSGSEARGEDPQRAACRPRPRRQRPRQPEDRGRRPAREARRGCPAARAR